MNIKGESIKMREPEMFEPMKKLLQSKGYKIISMKRGREPGPDITAESKGRRLIMEMKGDSALHSTLTSERAYSSCYVTCVKKRTRTMP